MPNEHEFDQPTAYEIRLKGILASSWSDWFGGFTSTVQGNDPGWLRSRSISFACHTFQDQ